MTQRTWALTDLLSAARMRPYLSTTEDDWEAALALYDWNVRISSALYESLHYLEIGLRNAMDATLRDRLGSEWLDSTMLTPRSRRAVSVARAQAGGSRTSHGKLVAELPFGFWWSLLSDEYNRRLWQPALQHAFDGRVRRRRLHAELDDLRRLRNRIAHHEPIHSRDLHSDYERLLAVAVRISPVLPSHVRRTSRVRPVLSERPRP